MVAYLTVLLCPSALHGKEAGVFYPPQLLRRARENVATYDWASRVQDGAVEAARPWMGLSDDELWGLMFGSTITRSWMVWSNGHCPACGEPVPMYNWEMDPMAAPWKVRCPHCKEHFPKNDFGRFYNSGLDAHGVFDPARADRSLLFNPQHPDANDPLHGFGVDDGEGYAHEGRRWRFIGAYLVYGQWKDAVLGGAKRLAEAYVLTGDPRYAHKAGILLDRVADLYPTFDYKAQGLVYEKALSSGYVSVWHDACEETRELALAYDQVFEGIKSDEALVAFLSAKARKHGLENPKASFADIQRNIEDRILRDALANRAKVSSNYPRTDICYAIIKAVLDWPGNRDEVMAIIDPMLAKSTAVDGVTGEKGLANYSAFGLQSLALFIARWDAAIPGFLDEVLRRHPRLHQMYRFHIDTWCLNQYYPLSGDTGWFAAKIDQYQGVRFQRPGVDSTYSHKDALLSPSMFTFMWRLHELTEDPAFAQVLYIANDKQTTGLPHDVFAADPGAMARNVRQVIDAHGPLPEVDSVNKQQWRIAVLRSGRGKDARAVWLDYDSGGGHSHLDGMNLGLFAHGLDLMPDFGYPPVQFGGWGSAKATWYRMTAGHNTVVVDGKSQTGANGTTTLWAMGDTVRLMRASAPGMIRGKQYERNVASVDVAHDSFYVIDVFRVVGGTDHAKFMHSHFGSISATGLNLTDTEDYGHGTQMRSFRVDPSPAPGWHVDWTIEDRRSVLDPPRDIGVRYTDLTAGAAAYTAEAWVVAGTYNSTDTAWIPRVMVRRSSEAEPLASTFVSVIEPHERVPRVASIRRLALATAGGEAYPDGHVALRITLADGRQDLFIAADIENPLGIGPRSGPEDRGLVAQQADLALDGQWCFVRLDSQGHVLRAALSMGTRVRVGETVVELVAPASEAVEVVFQDGRASVVRGARETVSKVLVAGQPIPVD